MKLAEVSPRTHTGSKSEDQMSSGLRQEAGSKHRGLGARSILSEQKDDDGSTTATGMTTTDV